MRDVNWDLYVDVLRTNHAKGLSAEQIATLIPGATRNAVIGKIHRLKLVRDAKVKGPPKQRERKPKIVRNAPTCAPLIETEKTSGGVQFLELTDAACRWMLGDGTYCGCAVVAYRKPYCPVHAETAKRKT